MLCMGTERGAQLEEGRAMGSAGSQMAPGGAVEARQELEVSRLESEAVWELWQDGGKDTLVVLSSVTACAGAVGRSSL